ncbi:TadE/TadG family type IV pilus assembly protein [Exercitatus varius]|uniref:TadE/TadG family type IV pilus assembly protein n=1 Tax=Exercitatus varius TaxID=67857 RepID=UPI00294B2B41|nr:pilus assembly protein [Exercitatus varius]MDG2943688.1 pilus assembly protein [Exercitatus varius]
MNKIKQLLFCRKGVSTIEFTLTVGIFFMVVFMILELARLTLFTAYWDYLLTESVRITKNQRAENNDYAALFKRILTEQHRQQGNPVLALFEVRDEKVEAKVEYAESVDDLVNEVFRQPTVVNGVAVSPTGANASIARYSLNYSYRFLVPLPFIAQEWISPMFKREIFVVQEYERDQFRY